MSIVHLGAPSKLWVLVSTYLSSFPQQLILSFFQKSNTIISRLWHVMLIINFLTRHILIQSYMHESLLPCFFTSQLGQAEKLMIAVLPLNLEEFFCWSFWNLRYSFFVDIEFYISLVLVLKYLYQHLYYVKELLLDSLRT